MVDDHPVFRHGICQHPSHASDVTICGEAANAKLALKAMRLQEPDMVLMDVSLPGTNGNELINHMLAERPSLIILMRFIHEESPWLQDAEELLDFAIEWRPRKKGEVERARAFFSSAQPDSACQFLPDATPITAPEAR